MGPYTHYSKFIFINIESFPSVGREGPPTHLNREAAPMTSRYYHTPPPPISTRVRCPVCHEAVYSRAGIHPQCAVRLADPPRPKAKPPAAPAHAVRAAGAPEQAGAGVVTIPADPPGRSAAG